MTHEIRGVDEKEHHEAVACWTREEAKSASVLITLLGQEASEGNDNEE